MHYRNAERQAQRVAPERLVLTVLTVLTVRMALPALCLCKLH